MIRAICFDFDGTLAHFTGDFTDLLDQSYAKLGLDPQTRDAVLAEYAEQLCKNGAVTSYSALIEALKHLNLPIDANLKEVNAEFVHSYRKQMELLPNAKEVLDFCFERVPLALITNGPEDMQRAAIQEVGVAEYFQAVLISGVQEVAVRKPDARMFQLACERLKVSPEEVLMVGDNLEADTRGALNVGMKAVYLGKEEVEGLEHASNLFELQDYLRDLLN